MFFFMRHLKNTKFPQLGRLLRTTPPFGKTQIVVMLILLEAAAEHLREKIYSRSTAAGLIEKNTHICPHPEDSYSEQLDHGDDGGGNVLGDHDDEDCNDDNGCNGDYG